MNPAGNDDAAATARRLLDIVNGSWMSQAIYVAAALGIPDVLATRAMTSEELAGVTGAHPPSLRRLMRALATIEICKELEDRSYILTTMGSLLCSDAADSLRSWTLYWGGPLWPIWGQLLHSVTTGESARTLATGAGIFDRLEVDAEEAAVFNRAMVELTRLESASIARALDLSTVHRIVDVGGGYGALLGAVLQVNPGVRGVLFDRPHALENGKIHMEAKGVADRCEFVAGDFFESVPEGADAYLLKSVIHDWNDERSMCILGNCRTAMRGDARLLLVERVVPTQLESSALHRAIARADLNMLVGPGGQERTEDEYRALLSATNFALRAVHAAGSTFSVIEAVRSHASAKGQ